MKYEVKKVSLVGAGPGDENLLTVKAMHCIENADVIIYDNLINPTILNNVKSDAELIYAGKAAGNHHMSQDEINETIKKYALIGKYVVRLKGGDPYVFGRGAEEAQYLIQNNIDFETVHGVSSFYAALGYAGIPVTHRDCAEAFYVFTGHRKHGENFDLDFKSIAKLSGSLIFLMGLSNIDFIAEGLIKNGMAPDTGAAVVENGTRYNQRVFKAGLIDIAKVVKEKKVISPAVIAVGNVCEKDLTFLMKEKMLLSGKNILLTATKELCDKMAPVFESLGANICKISLIAVKEVEVKKEVFINELKKSTHILLTSANGVDFFWKKIRELNIDIRSLYDKKICVIGSKSAEELNKYGINADFIPSKFDSKTFLEEISVMLNNKSHVLMLRAKEGNDTLPKGLGEAGIKYSDIPIYETVIDERRKFELNREIKKVDYIVVASGSAARALFKMIDDKEFLREKIISIGPVTTGVIREFGINEKATALKYDVEGIVDVIGKL